MSLKLDKKDKLLTNNFIFRIALDFQIDLSGQYLSLFSSFSSFCSPHRSASVGVGLINSFTELGTSSSFLFIFISDKTYGEWFISEFYANNIFKEIETRAF